MEADELWGLVRSIKQRRHGLDVPATDSQTRAISRLLPDGPVPEGLSKLEASTLIERLVAERPATEAQLEFLERLGYEGEAKGMGMREASEAIDGLLAESRDADGEDRDEGTDEHEAPTDEQVEGRPQIDPRPCGRSSPRAVSTRPGPSSTRPSAGAERLKSPT